MTERNSLMLGMAVLIFLLGGCAMKMVGTIEKGDRLAAGNRVLIATQASEFKDAVVTEITDALEEDSCYLKIIDVRNLADENPRNYHAIVIVNTCLAWNPNRHVSAFLKTVPDRQKLVVLTTADGEDWELDLDGVDAVTSASIMDKSKPVAWFLLDKVRAILDSGI